mgnify:CR=1 FL=1|tara:strand:- start:589 stop:1014 length:426 start_codon:yes stop_codon:yes gene_type:complete
MKITKELLKQIIKEEIKRTLTEQGENVKQLEEKKFNPTPKEMADALNRAVEFGKILQKDLTKKGTLIKTLNRGREEGVSEKTMLLVKQYFTQIIQGMITNRDLIYRVDRLMHDKYLKMKDKPGIVKIFAEAGFPFDPNLLK